MAQNVYTVKQVNAYIKNMFTQDYMLSHIYVKGEVSNCKYHTSGHIYFSLKDESGTIACVMFAGQRGGLSFRLSEGQQVVVLGSISTYERSGVYQLYAREIRLDGEGALYERFEALKKELEEMGMFDAQYKQPIPAYVRKVGVVTAPTGAAIHDIINITRRRNPYVQLILYPAQVQGEGASQSVARGIRMMSGTDVDVLIVGRGGGSMEDLWAFNEEEVARAIFDCPIPVISAVGHETDTTIADYVADLRAPTPSAAAELAVYDYRQFLERLAGYARQLTTSLTKEIELKRARANTLAARLHALHPRNQMRENRMRLVEQEEKLHHLMEIRLSQEQHRYTVCLEKLKALNPLSKLEQGYAYVQKEDGRTVTGVGEVSIGEKLQISVTDGTIDAAVTDTKEEDHGRGEYGTQ